MSCGAPVVRFERRIASEIGKRAGRPLQETRRTSVGRWGCTVLIWECRKRASSRDALTRWIRDDEASDILAYREHTLNCWQALLSSEDGGGVPRSYPASIQPHGHRLAWTLPVPGERLPAALKVLASS